MNPKYVWYDRTDDTSRHFSLPENSIYDARAGIRLGGVPPELFPKAALELSVWQTVSYRDLAGRYGLAERPQESEHLTQKTWTRGGIYTFWGYPGERVPERGHRRGRRRAVRVPPGRRPPPACRVPP